MHWKPPRPAQPLDARSGRCSAVMVGVGLLMLALDSALAASNVDPARAYAWSANLGWLNWRPDSASGVDIGQYVCSGWIYSGNVGWITLGSGAPANGVAYANNSATDFGVNVNERGELRGLAYGANIGWISFENTGAPRVDLTAGKLTGFAYGANVGWINLGDAGFSVAVKSISAGNDTDSDGLPDAWELSFTKNLTTLTAAGDADADGQSDLDEYLAGTDPLNPDDSLRVVRLTLSPDESSSTITWTSKGTRQYAVETRPELGGTAAWSDSGLGLQLPDGQLTTRTLPAGQGHEFFRVRAVRPLMP